jgi:hypothetical protein
LKRRKKRRSFVKIARVIATKRRLVTSQESLQNEKELVMNILGNGKEDR